jgi:hypothetical protein
MTDDKETESECIARVWALVDRQDNLDRRWDLLMNTVHPDGDRRAKIDGPIGGAVEELKRQFGESRTETKGFIRDGLTLLGELYEKRKASDEG